MKTLIIASLFLIPALCFGQAKKKQAGYISFALGVNVPVVENGEPAIGGHFSANALIGKGGYVGLEAGVVKFQDLDGVYIPIQFKFTLLPAKDPKKLSPLITLAPGYGVYNKTYANIVSTTGGFVFFGGLGVAFPSSKGGGRGFLSVGYSLFGFTVNEKNANVETVGIRAGIMLH